MQTDRWTDRQKHTQRKKTDCLPLTQTDKTETNRHADSTDRKTNRHAGRQTHKQTHTHTAVKETVHHSLTQTDTQHNADGGERTEWLPRGYRHADRQKDKQACRQTDRQINTHTDTSTTH